MGAIMYALKACHETLHAMGCPRIASKYVFVFIILSSQLFSDHSSITGTDHSSSSTCPILLLSPSIRFDTGAENYRQLSLEYGKDA